MNERTDLAMRFFEATNYAAITGSTPIANALYLDLETVSGDNPDWSTGTVHYWDGSTWSIYGGPRNFPH